MNPKVLAVAVVLSTVCLLVPLADRLSAHHSFAAEFDGNKPVTLVGTITKVQWVNPHSWLYIDVKNDQGDVESWAIEWGAINGLIARGWRRSDLPVGATVTVKGFLAKDGSRKLGAGSKGEVRLPDGRILFDGIRPSE